MFKDFDDFLNEGKKYPDFSVGDIVKTASYEYDYGSSMYKATNVICGAILIITEIKQKSGKNYYTAKIEYGGFRNDQKRSRNYSSYSDYALKSTGNINGFAKDFTKEGVDEFIKILKKNEPKFKVGDEISVAKGAERFDRNKNPSYTTPVYQKITTKKVKAIAVDQTINRGEICYLLSDDTYAVPEKYLSSEVEVDDKQITELSEEIAKKLGAKIYKEDNNSIKYEVESLDETSFIAKGKIYFSTPEDKMAFAKEFSKLVKKYVDPEMKKVFSRSASAGVLDMSKPTSEWGYPELSKTKVVEAAKNLGIDVPEFLEKRKGNIASKDYGI
jgi:hypothetical protein